MVSFISDLKNALILLGRGEWSEFKFRLRVYLGHVDLKTSYLEELNLQAERSHYYDNSGGLYLQKVLESLEITSQDSILDFGSGKGGALFTFSKFPFAKITGCELSRDLVVIAKKNLEVMNVKNVTLILNDAADFTDLDEYNYFYFFNPFPCTVMNAVVRNMTSSVIRKPRKMTIIYLNPECHESIVNDSPFIKINEYRFSSSRFSIYSNEY